MLTVTPRAECGSVCHTGPSCLTDLTLEELPRTLSNFFNIHLFIWLCHIFLLACRSGSLPGDQAPASCIRSSESSHWTTRKSHDVDSLGGENRAPVKSDWREALPPPPGWLLCSPSAVCPHHPLWSPESYCAASLHIEVLSPMA